MDSITRKECNKVALNLFSKVLTYKVSWDLKDTVWKENAEIVLELWHRWWRFDERNKKSLKRWVVQKALWVEPSYQKFDEFLAAEKIKKLYQNLNRLWIVIPSSIEDIFLKSVWESQEVLKEDKRKLNYIISSFNKDYWSTFSTILDGKVSEWMSFSDRLKLLTPSEQSSLLENFKYYSKEYSNIDEWNSDIDDVFENPAYLPSSVNIDLMRWISWLPLTTTK